MAVKLELKSQSFDMFHDNTVGQYRNCLTESQTEELALQRLAKLNTAEEVFEIECLPADTLPPPSRMSSRDERDDDVRNVATARTTASRQSLRSRASRLATPKLPGISSACLTKPRTASANRHIIENLKCQMSARDDSEKVLISTLQPDHVNTARHWIDDASATQRRTIQDLLRGVEVDHFRETIGRTLKPHAGNYVEKWMHGADNQEKTTVLKFFGYLNDQERQTKVGNYKHSKGRPLGGVPAQRTFMQENPRRSATPSTKKRTEQLQTWHHGRATNYWPPPDPNGFTQSFFTRPTAQWRRSFTIHPEWVP